MKTSKQMQEEINKNFPFIEMLEEYQGGNTKILLRCAKCGHIWKAIPRSVAKSKCGCPKCGILESRRQKSKEEFLNKLDSSFELIQFNNYEDVIVRCKKCGNERHTTSSNILRFGCGYCKHKESGQKRSMNQEEFIYKSNIKHNNKYNYSKTNYINCKTPVTIICPIHGEFEQKPIKHLSGQGCPKCVGKNWTREDFIVCANKIHNNKYNYSNLEWNGFTKTVKIICPIHGEFNQNAYVHLRVGCGCPKCSQSHGEREVSKCLSDLKIEYCYQYYIKNPYKNNNFCVDFYIEYNNCTYIIEYNGRQHYEPVERFGGEEAFKKQIERDQDLRNYCSENNIQLLEIEYTTKFENIMSIIKDFIAVPIEKSSELLETNIGEDCDVNPEISTETKESVPSYSVDGETYIRKPMQLLESGCYTCEL